MSNEKVDRRGYLKYAGAGIVVVAVAGVGGYYATRPGPSPTVQPTTVTQVATKQETVTQAQTVTATMSAGPSLPMTTPKDRYLVAFSNGEMVDPWRFSFVQDMEVWAKQYAGVGGTGFDFVVTNSYQDSAKQLADCETLLAMEPDALVVSPYEAAPLDPIYDKCNDAEVPLFCIDREILNSPSDAEDDYYIQAIIQDWYYNGRVSCQLLVDKLTEINGAPEGNCVWVLGAIGSSPQIGLNVGIADYLQYMNDYSGIQFLDARPGDWDAALTTSIIEDYLTRYSAGEIDFIYTNGSIMGMAAVEVAKRFGRDEFIGNTSGGDCYMPWLDMISQGEGAFSTECTPYYGYTTLESVIKYLNGEKVDPYKFIPIRSYTSWMNVDILKKHVAEAKKQGVDYPTTDMGNFEELVIPGVNGIPDWWSVGDPTPMPNVV